MSLVLECLPPTLGSIQDSQRFQQSELLDCRVERTMSCVDSVGFMWMCQLQRDSRQSCPSAGAESSSSVHLVLELMHRWSSLGMGEMLFPFVNVAVCLVGL